MKVLITGAAGFIGAHTALRLLKDGYQVTGIDNFNSHYDPKLKRDRLAWVRQQVDGFPLHQLDLGHLAALAPVFEELRPEVVIHLASGPSQTPTGWLNLQTLCQRYAVQHLIYANNALPCVLDIPATGLTFYTVYGPWGRPDMTPVLFAQAIRAGDALGLYQQGLHLHDFSYIDDVVDALTQLIAKPPAAHEQKHRRFTIGGQRQVALTVFIAALEEALQQQARVHYLPGALDTPSDELCSVENLTGFRPQLPLSKGVANLVQWFNDYYPLPPLSEASSR